MNLLYMKIKWNSLFFNDTFDRGMNSWLESMCSYNYKDYMILKWTRIFFSCNYRGSSFNSLCTAMSCYYTIVLLSHVICFLWSWSLIHATNLLKSSSYYGLMNCFCFCLLVCSHRMIILVHFRSEVTRP